MKPAVKAILLGQILLYVGLFVCVLIKPAGLATNDGISYYGIFRETFLFYAAGLLGAAYFTMRAAVLLDSDKSPVIRTALKIYAPLIVGIVITPYAAGH